jgi:hypothetical protein
MLMLYCILRIRLIRQRNITRIDTVCCSKAIIQPVRSSQDAFLLTNYTKDYRHKSVSSPDTDLLLALHSVFDNIGLGAKRRALRDRKHIYKTISDTLVSFWGGVGRSPSGYKSLRSCNKYQIGMHRNDSTCLQKNWKMWQRIICIM